ncbi:MAG: glycosyltransferase family 2 protein [Planctomycetaceae bacterium]|nr:glycosyltransferase family 2 protein [Planctomycetaceae bacterium]
MTDTPARDGSDPLVSIVIPCLNEEICVGECVDWCHQGLQAAGVSGEILIVDNGSTDRSPDIAAARGARVLRVPKRGLGRAYIDAIPYIKGKYIIMGDSDLTYDFRELKPFIAKLDEGYEFVMGSRFRGYIEPGAMPKLHRYFGTPLTTWLLNLIYGTRYSDIHCGMRALTYDALQKINIESQSWEYASEMVLKAARLKLRATEVPIRFYKDREGRRSHMKRAGWLGPWVAGWLNLKAMFLYAPDYFVLRPGWVMLVVGLILTLLLSCGPLTVIAGVLVFNLHTMLLGITLATLGYSSVQLGTLARVFYNFNPRQRRRLAERFTYDGGMVAAGGMVAVGVLINLVVIVKWLRAGLRLPEVYHPGLFGLLLIILGFQTFVFTLMFQMINKMHVKYDSISPSRPHQGAADRRTGPWSRSENSSDFMQA